MRESKIEEKKKKRERYMCTYVFFFCFLDDILMHPQAYFEMPPHSSPSTYNKSIKISTIT